MRSERPEILRAIAVIGNAVGLFVLVLVLLNARAIFRGPPAADTVSTFSPAVQKPGSRLLFILLDGLRADVAENAQLMPELNALAARGSRGVAWVEALIPSTVAGLRAEVEGIVAPPAGFVFDFASAAAPRGGFLELNRRQGEHSFVAAPSLWRDLYGQWIDDSAATDQLDGEDQRLLEAALPKVADPAWRVVVVHLSRPDVAGHLAGGASSRYRAAAAWCDAAIGQLARQAGSQTTIVVTSDHGTTDRGGHAGPEPVVHRIPIVAAGPGAPLLPPNLRQVEIARLLEAVLTGQPILLATKVVLQDSASWGAKSASTDATSARSDRFWSLPLALLAAVAVLRLLAKAARPEAQGSIAPGWESFLRHVPGADENARHAFCLHLGLWISGACGFLSAAGAAVAGTLWLLLLSHRRTLRTPLLWLLLIATLGLLVGFARVHGAVSTMHDDTASPALLSWRAYLCQAGGALLLGFAGSWGTRCASRRSRGLGWLLAVTLGAAIVLCADLALAWRGENVSLSTLNVRAAWAVSQTWAGLPGTILVAALQPSFIHLCLLVGSVPPLAAMQPRLLPSVAAGAGACFMGQALAASALFAWHQDVGSPAVAADALGLLLRVVAEVALFFPACALLTWATLQLLPDRGELATIPAPTH